ncbi:MAG TPA: YXWGXW repeat-containing protein, partial [Candidatus Acidoferrum sp.]|nr:YXWGXW repeat-containing protein [Candidatus Acidoferrum sp.]
MNRFILILGTLAVACALFIGTTPAPASAQVSVGVGISVGFGPPAIPYYVQPAPPGPNWIWQPGYWAYDPVDGYYWVPGTWV